MMARWGCSVEIPISSTTFGCRCRAPQPGQAGQRLGRRACRWRQDSGWTVGKQEKEEEEEQQQEEEQEEQQEQEQEEQEQEEQDEQEEQQQQQQEQHGRNCAGS